MRNINGQKQVSLAGFAGTPKKEKKPFPWEWIIVSIVPLLAIGAVLVFLWLIGVFDSDEGRSLPAEQMVQYTVTPDSMADRVSYYAVGISGESGDDRLDAVGVLCFDREKNTISVVQMPVTTYVGKDTGFAVKALGDVWAKPQSVPFCSSHMVRLTEEEIENNTHLGCGAPVELQKGSASGDLIRVFNEQYGLPIDNFVVIPRAGLAQLIDGLGGVDVKLSQKVKLAGETYKAGVQTLSGDAAVAYITTYGYQKTTATDRERMLRQREVFAAVLQRIAALEMEDLFAIEDGATVGIFGDVMIGEYPVRFNSTSYGKEQLIHCSAGEADSMKTTEAIARFFRQVSQVPLENITCSILPGEAVKSGTATVYTVNRQQTIELLNQQMNPYGLTLNEETVTAQQAVNKADTVELETATLDTVAQPQTGTLETEE